MEDRKTPSVTKQDIIKGLQELGLKLGDGLLVHSSLSSFGHVVGGADAVIDALLEVVGEEGIVLVPTLTGTEHDGPAQPPVFDVRHSPCWTGRIPAVFMEHSEAKRSLHPTHSVAGIGYGVDFLLAGHADCVTPCGLHSPYYRLAEWGGHILLIGVGQGSNTTLHTCEELAEVPYHLQKQPTEAVIIDHMGNEHTKSMYLHDWGTPRQFERIDNELISRGIMKIGQVGASTLRLIRSMDMIRWLVEVLQEEPRYLCL
ncbi:MAG: AAC(3) family N-acetyltransferase [Firmicutes bacterium]|nr:AAC(3) family N-acetyltransferase [Bacillota bacterium]